MKKIKKLIQIATKKVLLSVAFAAFLFNAVAADEILQVQNVFAGDSYPHEAISPWNLVNMNGLSPNPPEDLENTTYRMVDNFLCWHSSGSNNSKAYIVIDFANVCPISKIYIWNLNHHDSGGAYRDRDTKDISITYSIDSSDGLNGTWEELGDYVIPQTAGNKTPTKAQLVVDANITARFIKVQAKSSYGSIYWGLGKIVTLRDLFYGDSPAMKALKEQLVIAKGYKFYNYTDGSYAPLAASILVAQNLITAKSEDDEALIDAKQALIDAIPLLIAKTNLALGSAASADSYYSSGYEASQAVDGDFNTRWASQYGRTNFWFKIDLRSAKTFNQVMIFENRQYGKRITNVQISVSDDGTNWVPWREKQWSNYYLSAVGEKVTKRYIQIVFPNSNKEGLNIDEIMVFNDDSAIETVVTPPRPTDPSWIKQIPATDPNVYQIRKAHLKYGMFIHYGINTFLGQEWTDGSSAASAYNPNLATLDPESWVKAAYEGGMNFVILITKHHEGFALWDTQYGTYNINNTGRAGDKRDIVKEVSDACKKYGIKLGLYYSAWDRNWDRNNTIESTGLDQIALNQLYNDYALNHIEELLDGRYGEICELWIDGAWEKSNDEWEFARLYNTVKTLQPSCQFGVNNTIKNPSDGGNSLHPDQANGGEEMYFFPSDFRLLDPFLTRAGANADPKVYSYKGQSYYLPFEATVCINNSWFWNSTHNSGSVLSASNIQKAYNHLVEQDNTLVLNLSPNKNGVFDSFDVNGLYAGAKTMGIARGSARNNIQPGECMVEIKYTTNKGYVAFPTKYIYGAENEAYAVLPENLNLDGYKLLISPENTEGLFAQEKITVEFIYEDMGVSFVPNDLKAINKSSNTACCKGENIVISCAQASKVAIYNLLGVKQGEWYMEEGINTIDASHLQGVYFVQFATKNKNTYTTKIIK